MSKSAYFLPRVVFGHVKLYDDQGEVVATFENVAAFEAVIEMTISAYDFKMRGRAAAGNEIEPAHKLNVD